MRSRTSRGVPEWSGGKDLYMESPVLVTGKVSGFSGNIPGPPGGSRGSTKWGHKPRRAAWAKCGRGPAPGGLVRPPTKAQGARESGRGQTLGSDGPKAHLVVRPPLSPLGRPPRWDLGLAATPRGGNLGGGAAPPFPLYIVGVLGCHTHENIFFLAQPYPSPSSSLAVLGEALLECHAPPPPPRRRAAAGWSLPQPLPLSLLDQGVGDVTGLYVC